LTAALELAGRHPVDNVLVLAKMRSSGLEPKLVGHPILGAFDPDGRLAGLLSQSISLTPVELAAPLAAAVARRLGPTRRAGSLAGPRDSVVALWSELVRLSPGQWGRPRDFRDYQPLLVLDHDPDVPADPTVGPVGPNLAPAYYQAAVAMYSEEIGLSPVEATGSYRRHVEDLMRQGRTFGHWDGRQIVFKTDVAVASGPVCQLGGVWLHPEWRGRGLSAPALSAVVRACRRRWPIVSLYVNQHNQVARALYRRLGFVQAGEFATVLW
jgi:ribosomal protein S18 acetylase RimI-like enzyme